MEPLTVRGVWWCPRNPEAKLSGTLVFEGTQHPRLRLLGVFPQAHEEGQRIPIEEFYSDEPIILGLGEGNELLTLWRCYGASFNVRFPGPASCEYMVMTILLGRHFADEEGIAARAQRMRFPLLEDWIGPTGFKNIVHGDGSEPVDVVDVEYQPIEKTEVMVPDGQSVVLQDHFAAQGSSRDLRLRNRTLMEFRGPESRHLGQVGDVAWMGESLLWLLIGQPVHPTEVEIAVEDSSRDADEDDEVWLEVRYAIPESTLARPVRKTELARWVAARPYWGRILTAWFAQQERLSSVVELLRGLLGSSTPGHGRFMRAYTALEALMRIRSGPKYLTKSEFKEARRRIIEVLPEDLDDRFRDNVARGLAFTNEYSQRDRLKMGIDETRGVFAPNEIQYQFVKDCLNTRNYRTHFDPKLREKAKSGEALEALTSVLRLLFEALLLIELGLSDEEVGELLEDNQRLAHVRGGSLGWVQISRTDVDDDAREDQQDRDESKEEHPEDPGDDHDDTDV